MFLYVKKYAVDNGTEVHGVFYQGFVAAARGSAGKVWCREPCKKTKEFCFREKAEVGLPSARMALAFSSLLLTVAVPPGPSYCRPTTRKSVFRGDCGFDDRPHVDRPLHGLPPVDGEFPGEDHRLLIERVLRVEEAHLGPDFFGPDGRTVRRRNPWLTPLGRGLGGDRKGQIGHLLNADMGLGETEFPLS